MELGNVVLNQRKAHRNIGSSCNKKKMGGVGGGDEEEDHDIDVSLYFYLCFLLISFHHSHLCC